MRNSPRYIIIAFIISLLSIAVSAQRKRNVSPALTPEQTAFSHIAQQYADSLTALRIKFDSLTAATDVNSNESLLINPYYYRLFVNPMLYRSSLKQAMDIRLADDSNTGALASSSNLKLNSSINDFFLNLYTQHPNMVRLTDADLEKEGGVRTDINKKLDYKATVSDKVKKQELEGVVEPVVAISRKPNFWTFGGKLKLQLMQNYISDNWYKGGSSSNSMIYNSTFWANYNNKQKVQWDNKLEMNLGFQTNKDDTHHSFKTNTDLLRMTNKLGIRASGHWYYTVSLQSWTQFYRKYANNSDYIYSDFMSPFESLLSVGMDYKQNRKNYNLTVVLAPLSYDFIFVGRHDLTSRYGVPGRHHSYEKIGSNVTCNIDWKICKELTWTSRLFCFTNYKSVVAEWENTFNFKINKFLSSTLYLYPRFDDAYHSDKSHARIQFKEYLSMGLDWSFDF
ncbi:MAG: DUF3078 domain-containing protein [Bacteroidaceae bacterium]|nr:DUF3078 domain-containing protein [Bacteroidaceae bacterium]MBR4649460.1 DUF3078 domain-containing protein [Bacteroidaceae bacterium]MBR6714802.1 DUF3078 domain-containing protein [Bacteroidaceae bacterium]